MDGCPRYFSVRRDSPSRPTSNFERIVGHRNADGQVRERLHISVLDAGHRHGFGGRFAHVSLALRAVPADCKEYL
jgi:hypothetical protein